MGHNPTMRLPVLFAPSRAARCLLLVGVTAAWLGCSGGGDDADPKANPGLTPGTGAAAGSGGAGGSGQGGTSASGGGAGQGASSGIGGAPDDAGTGGVAGQDGSIDGPAPDVGFGYDAPITDTSLNPDTACGASVFEATLTPLDMYIMLDRSGSMVEPGYSWTALSGGGITITGGDCNFLASGTPLDSRWCYSIYALAGYFNSAEAEGNRAALQFYPVTGYSCDGPVNNTLATPAVGLQDLTGGANTLIGALNAEVPLGSNTPTKAALHGIAGFTSTHQANGRITIGVLITDGVPNSCAPDDGPTLGAVAAAHLAATGIRTYVIGMTGASFNVLEDIATQGGAPSHAQYCAAGINPCHFYDVGQGNSQVFIDVLQAIQKTAIGCTYSMPTTDAGIVDPNQIAVQYTVGGVGVPKDLVKVSGPGACVVDGWYYDGNAPPNIVLCPQTCSQVQADPQAKVDILVGCEGS